MSLRLGLCMCLAGTWHLWVIVQATKDQVGMSSRQRLYRMTIMALNAYRLGVRAAYFK